MSISALSGLSGLGLLQAQRQASVIASTEADKTPAQPIASGSMQPLSSGVLATLIGQQLSSYGSYSGD